MNERPSALEFREVVRSYGQGEATLQILRGTSFLIEPGELVALIAPSGAGKSTLLHLAGLLERPDGGDVIVGGQSCGALDDAGRTATRRRRIGFVYQFHHLLPELSALENVTMPQLIRGRSSKEADAKGRALLAAMGLSHRLDHRPGEMSGGEQQRVAIARAVANDPNLLLADEPTGNLDPETSDHVFAMLAEFVRNSGLAALIATHNHALAAKMDRVITLEGGNVVGMEVARAA